MRFVSSLILLYLCGITAMPVAAQEFASISGVVTDASEGQPLAGTNVILLSDSDGSMVQGTATDHQGRYSLNGIEPGSYVLAFRFIGFSEERVDVTVDGGEALEIPVELTSTGLDLSTVVVTASRQAEKVLDAPASISVLDAEEIATNVVPSSAAVLRNTTGVDMAQTGIDRYEIVLRGFNNAFSGAAYVLTDYRQGAIASLGVNAYQMMPITQIDLERVEVVRGPGSALYGPGVDAGVVHFISKDPFTHPGTTVMVGGGTREMLLASARHAGFVNEKWGYKFVGNFSRANEWEFDPNNRLDSLQLASFRREALPVDYENYKYNLNGSLAYRFSPGVTLTANGGFSSSKSIFLSGIGTLQSDGFGYTYGQLRLDANRFFAQAYINANNAGDSFVYRDTAVEDVVDQSILFSTQAQYELGMLEDQLRLIVGADYELTRPATENTINGRNEEDDDIVETGVYAQGSYRISEFLDATGALRADYNNVVDELQLSPRAALVYKPNAQHSIRATYNRAFSSPGSNSLFLDIDAGRAAVLRIRARGAAQGFNFEELPDGGYTVTSLLPYNFGWREHPDSSPISSREMRLSPLYGAIYEGLVEFIQDPDSELPPPLNALSPEQLNGLLQLLHPDLTAVEGSVPTDLGFVNLTTVQVDRFTDNLTDIEPLRQTVSQTFELGYKGLLGEKLLLAVDAYYVQKKNFVGPLRMETPFVLVPGIRGNFEAALASGIADNPQLVAALEQLQDDGVIPPGVPVEIAAANLISGLAQAQDEGLRDLFEGTSAVSDSLTPIGIVQPEEHIIPGGLLLSYRNYGNVRYFGVDVTSELLVSDELRVFGNLSWVNDNFFEADELDEEGTNLELAMNAPKIKVKAGFDYAVPRGIRLSASVRHIGGFQVRSGPYEGEIEPYTLVDLGAGYDLSDYVSGMRLDVSLLNAFDNVHREFIGAPQLGRLAVARLTYNLP